jgi:hypothetical protein
MSLDSDADIFLVHGGATNSTHGLVSSSVKVKRRPKSSTRTFYGLTQTCEQLRSEFRALYQAHLRVAIQILQLEHYIDTFIPETRSKPL